MYRLIGASLVIIGCAMVGHLKTNTIQRNIRVTEELIRAVNIMICKLEFHRTPLPQLCNFVSERTEGLISHYFAVLEQELSLQHLPDVKNCFLSSISRCCELPVTPKELLCLMGRTLGEFGMDGQVEQLRYVKCIAENAAERISKRYERFGRFNQTLWVCMGIGLSVILI